MKKITANRSGNLHRNAPARTETVTMARLHALAQHTARLCADHWRAECPAFHCILFFFPYFRKKKQFFVCHQKQQQQRGALTKIRCLTTFPSVGRYGSIGLFGGFALISAFFFDINCVFKAAAAELGIALHIWELLFQRRVARH